MYNLNLAFISGNRKIKKISIKFRGLYIPLSLFDAVKRRNIIDTQ